MTDLWYKKSEIHFNRDQCIFLLENINLIKEGRWPLNSRETGYIDANIQANRNAGNAGFTGPVEIISELTRRIDACFPDWFFVYEMYTQGLTVEQIAKLHQQDYRKVQRGVNRAINYVASGNIPRWVETEKRHGVTYAEWSKMANARSYVNKLCPVI